MVRAIVLEQEFSPTCSVLENVVYGDVKLLTREWGVPRTRIDFYKIVSPVVITKKENQCIDKNTYCIYCNREDYCSFTIDMELRKGFSFLINEVMKGRLTYGDELVISEGCGLKPSDVDTLIGSIPTKDTYLFKHDENEDVIYGEYKTVATREGRSTIKRYINILKSSLALTKTKSTKPPLYKIFVKSEVKASELKDALNKLASEKAEKVSVRFADREKNILQATLV